MIWVRRRRITIALQRPCACCRFAATWHGSRLRTLAIAILVLLFDFLALSDGIASVDLRTTPLIVVAFGTSLTHVGGWLEPLQEKLTRCLGRKVTVLDFGKNGETSEGALRSVGQVIEAHPDIVLVEFSANDAAWFKGFSLKRSRENTTKIV